MKHRNCSDYSKYGRHDQEKNHLNSGKYGYFWKIILGTAMDFYCCQMIFTMLETGIDFFLSCQKVHFFTCRINPDFFVVKKGMAGNGNICGRWMETEKKGTKVAGK